MITIGVLFIVLFEERSKQPRAGDRVVMLARRGQVQEADETVVDGADLESSPTAES
jgi:hypothetical protein